MAKSKEEKEALKAAKAAEKAKAKEKTGAMKKFSMETLTDSGRVGKPFVVHVPEDSLDEEGNAESAASGIYRHA